MNINLGELSETEWRVLERYTAELNTSSRRAGAAHQVRPERVALALLRRALRDKGRQYTKQDGADDEVMTLAQPGAEAVTARGFAGAARSRDATG